MAKIDVIEVNASAFHVIVSANRTTEHEVTVQPEYSVKLCNSSMSTLELVKNLLSPYLNGSQTPVFLENLICTLSVNIFQCMKVK
jgi:hypothetical protein